jgi:hypothetical protein
MVLEKLNAFTKDVSDLSDRPALNPTELKAQFDAAPDEVRQYLNKLIDALKKTTAGDSGAKNIGATTISGLTGTDVQTILGSLNTAVNKIKTISWFGLPGMNNWQNYGVPFNNLQYCKEESGFVTIRGLVKGGGNNTQITLMPVGFRPGNSEGHDTVTSGGFARINIESDGKVSLQGTYSDYLFLDGIRYYAEN